MLPSEDLDQRVAAEVAEPLTQRLLYPKLDLLEQVATLNEAAAETGLEALNHSLDVQALCANCR